MDSSKSETNTDLSSNTEERPETILSQSETTTSDGLNTSLRDALSAALNKNEADAPEESVPDAETTGEQVVAEQEVKSTPEKEPLTPPEHWPADERDRFQALPRETQEWLLSRNKSFETDVNRRLQELSAQKKQVEEFNTLFDPYKQQLELQGRSPTQVVQQLLAAQRYLESSPAEAIKWLAQSYNLDLAGLAPQAQEYTDPQVAALQREIQQLKQQQLQQQTTVQQTEQQNIQKVVAEFKEARRPDGQPKYPHFDTLRSLMAPLVSQGKSLEEAYNEVKYTMPEERQRIADEAAKVARADALKKAEDDRKAKVEKAKSTSTIIRSKGSGTEASTASKGSVRADLEDALKALQGRI